MATAEVYYWADGRAPVATPVCWQLAARERALCPLVRRYVLCNSCKSPDTLLDRDSGTRIMFLRCQQVCTAPACWAGRQAQSPVACPAPSSSPIGFRAVPLLPNSISNSMPREALQLDLMLLP